MTFQQILFYFFSLVLVVSALGVITARNPVHSALFLVFAFFNSAVIWLMLEAEFLAIVLVLVYVGAVMVLFLFVVMMLDIKVEELRASFSRYARVGVVVAVAVIAEIAMVIWSKSIDSNASGHNFGLSSLSSPANYAADYNNTKALGTLLYTEYLYPLQLAAVILVVAIVAAIVLTMRKRAGQKLQDVSAQVAVRAKDRVRIIKMAAEKKDGDAAAPEAQA